MILLAISRLDIVEMLEHEVEWPTLVFFIALFMVIAGAEETGLIQIIAEWVKDVSRGNLTAAIILILWVSAIASAFIDNIPFTATMLPIMAALAPACALTPHLPHPAVTLILFSIVAAACLSWLFTLSVVIAETFPIANVGSVMGIAAGFGAAGAIVFNTYVGRMMETLGSAQIFAVMAFLHPLAALLLWSMVRPERPTATTNPVVS